MYPDFQYEEITYREAASGWQDGVYHPRQARICPAKRPALGGEADWKDSKNQDGSKNQVSLKNQDNPDSQDKPLWIHSRVWREIEETGFGIYDYEETTRFVTTLPGSNYQVKVVLCNPTQAVYSCHIRVNGVVKKDGITVAPGEEREERFTACMTDGLFVLTFSLGKMEEMDSQVKEGNIYVRDVSLALLPEKEKGEKPTIYLVSDSTVQSYERQFYPQTGWGQVLYECFQGAEAYREYPARQCTYPNIARTYELPGLVIENRAIGGRSARSFYDEGKLDQVLEQIRPGDYMFVQFAHNDATAIRPNRYIDPEEFPWFLQRYLDACRRRKVQCVLVTPVAMRVPDEKGVIPMSFAPYREQMCQVARTQGIPLLDLGARSTAYLNEVGLEESKGIYLWLEEGEYPEGAYSGGVSDKAHLQEYGAKVYANMVAQLIAEYRVDDALAGLQELVAPRPVEQIPKPAKFLDESGRTRVKAADSVTGFVAQEVSVENGQGSFLLNWNPVTGADHYHIYAKRETDLTYELVREVTREEKERFATLPFTAREGSLWQYYVTAVYGNGRESHASKVVEVDLRV